MPDYLKEARRAKREGDYSKAGDFFYLGGDEKSAMEMYLKGGHYVLAARMLEKNNDWKGAAKQYLQAGKVGEAAEIYANKLKDYRTASAMFEKNGDFNRASQMAEKSGDIPKAALLADQGELLERAANLYVQAQKYERAAEVYYRLLKQYYMEREERGFLETHRNRMQKIGNAAGSLFMRLKKYEIAADCFEKIENFPKAAECLTFAEKIERAAELYYKTQNYQKAYELLSSLAGKLESRELLADICFQLKRYGEAGDIYLQLGRLNRAADAFEKSKDFHKAALFYESLEDSAKSAELYLQIGERQKAAELFEKSKNLEYAAKLYQEAGNTERAVECLARAGLTIRAAKILVERNEMQQAVSLLQQIQPDHDEYTEACILLGQLFIRMEMYSVAQQKFEEVLHNQPLSKDTVQIYYGLAIAYEKSAQYTKAVEIYEKILSVDLKYQDVLERLKKIRSSNLLDGVSSEPTPASVKRILATRYELQEKIGKDSFGLLYKAEDTVLGRPVMIRRFPLQDKNITRNILEQTKIVSGLVHSNILTIYDSGKDENHHFICMEYVDGNNLRTLLSRGALDISDACELTSQICLALSYAHKKNVIHKNLCPENIYVSSSNQVKIANFGIETKSEKGNTLIAKQYISPEQLTGQKIDGRSDLYAVGVLLYEMLYGKPPFVGQDIELQHLKQVASFPRTSPHAVPVFLLRMMQKCLQKDKQKRYASADEILEELEVADIVPGMVLNQRYEIIREIGAGGMGHVYQAKDRDLDETVALKLLRAEMSADPVIQKRFLREIKVTRMITHPNVVKVFDTGKYKGNRYISMEYIDGVSLDEWLKKNRGDLRTLLSILAKILQGVHAAHSQGVIHRDLKPQNVLLDKLLNPHVLDFGIARSKEHVDATSGQVMGSPKYMSPEQIQGRDLDARSDIYALGVLMFYMFTGEEPFTGEDPRAIVMKHLTQSPPQMRQIRAQIPEWLEKIVYKALEKERNNRYSSLKEVLDDLKKGYETQKM